MKMARSPFRYTLMLRRRALPVLGEGRHTEGVTTCQTLQSTVTFVRDFSSYNCQKASCHDSGHGRPLVAKLSRPLA